MILSQAHQSSLQQVWRYGCIGLIASGAHVLSAFALFYLFGLSPLIANFFAFTIAWGISYWGHFQWTFNAQTSHGISMPRFAVVSILGLVINQGIVWVVTDILGGSFILAISCVVIIIPIVSFLASKLWAFSVN